MSIATGIIGYGLAGSAFHAPVIAAVDELRLAAIATTRSAAVQADWPGVQPMTPGALIVDPGIELVVIATPNESHARLIRAALEAGKHVVVDKPFVLDPDEGEALIALAADKKRVLSVYQNRRYDDDFMQLRRSLADGSIGEVALFEARWDRFRPAIKPGWREEPGEGAGLLADLGPHMIDQALQLFGMPEAVSADVAVQRNEARVDDYFEVTLHYGRMRAILSAASLVAEARPRFAVHGDKGSFLSHGLDPQEAALRSGVRPDAPDYPAPGAPRSATLVSGGGERTSIPLPATSYCDFYRAMARAIAGDAPPPVDPADAVAGLRLLSLARRSAAQGRRIST